MNKQQRNLSRERKNLGRKNTEKRKEINEMSRIKKIQYLKCKMQ